MKKASRTKTYIRMNTARRILMLGSLTLICIGFIKCKSICFMYVHSKIYSNFYWYAASASDVILSRTSRTLWKMETPPGDWMGSFSIRVSNVSETNLTGLYMCVDKSNSISLCKVKVSDKIPVWVIRERSGLTIRTYKNVFDDVLYAKRDNSIKDGLHFGLTNNITKSGTTWVGDIVQGCVGMFFKEALHTREPPKKITASLKTRINLTEKIYTPQKLKLVKFNLTEYSTYFLYYIVGHADSKTPSLASKLTRFSDKTRTEISTGVSTTKQLELAKLKKKEFVCLNENLNLFPRKLNVPCLSIGSTSDAKRVLENAFHVFNETLDEHTNNDSQPRNLHVMQFIEGVEGLLIKIAENLGSAEYMDIKTNDFVAHIYKNQHIPLIFPGVKSSDNILVESEMGSSRSYPMVGILYKHLHIYMKENITMNNGSEKFYVNSKMIAAYVDSSVAIQRVVITLHPIRERQETSKTICAFWNTTGDQHFWGTSGCQKLSPKHDSGQVVCECTHLTNFALLTSVVDFEIPIAHKKVLDMLSLICCSISIGFLFVGIMIFVLLLCNERKRTTRYVLHLNLMIALLISQLLFITGIEATENRIICKSIAYLLHYFLLSSFTWMLVEGLFLYLYMIKVFSRAIKLLTSYMLLAWVFPSIVVLVSGLSNHKSYGTNSHCWLSNKDFAIWTFLGPVIAIIIANSIILCMVIYKIVTLSKDNKSVLNEVKIGLRASLILLPILGVTWVFGVFSINLETLAFQYVFSVMNGLQGFMVTIFHCFCNGEVRIALRRIFDLWTSSTVVEKYLERRMPISNTMSSMASKDLENQCITTEPEELQKFVEPKDSLTLKTENETSKELVNQEFPNEREVSQDVSAVETMSATSKDLVNKTSEQEESQNFVEPMEEDEDFIVRVLTIMTHDQRSRLITKV